jgi:hypothetical protein
MALCTARNHNDINHDVGHDIDHDIDHDVHDPANLYAALRQRRNLADVIPLVLDVLEQDPLASAGAFRGDLLRTLIDLPAEFWRRDEQSFRRYQAAVRAGAAARRELPADERMEFWSRSTRG